MEKARCAVLCPLSIIDCDGDEMVDLFYSAGHWRETALAITNAQLKRRDVVSRFGLAVRR